MPRPDWNSLPSIPVSLASNRHPIIVGHRGARGLAPENTLSAFQVAANLAIDGVEFDIQRTADGHLIVFHDETVERCTDGQGAVENLTLDALKQLDAGSKYSDVFRGERIPTLRELFDFLCATNLLVFLEIKDPWRYPGIEGQIIQLIREYDLVSRTQIRSFYHPSLHICYQLAPEIALSELWFHQIPTEFNFKTINALYSLYTSKTLAHLHENGLQATAWTVNEIDIARQLVHDGIDGLTTDFPDRMLQL
ncbi:MAG TPA: glycerophosphodiester phosphodiesterase family protein [Aggregatilineaceae bacterium]|nr:glycerophosphodiester phosphodiesterase family protein [Aggregatilineaceae bacterium]